MSPKQDQDIPASNNQPPSGVIRRLLNRLFTINTVRQETSNSGDTITVTDIGDGAVVAAGRHASAYTFSPKDHAQMMVPIKVFISSTWYDLQPERLEVERILNKMMSTTYIGMEYFGSNPKTTRDISLAEVECSNIYIGIFAHRYGSGITEAEYRKAISLNLPCFIYFKDPATPVQQEFIESNPEKRAMLESLKDELRKSHTIATFHSPDSLSSLVATDLHNYIAQANMNSTL
jgi:hypothetical protein